MAGLTPTPEQEAAIQAFLEGTSFRLRAVAGSGKTTTLRFLAEAAPDRRVLYAAFNRAIARAAQERFPPNAEVRTLHSVAYRAFVYGPWRRKLRAANGALPLHQIVEATGLAPLQALAVRAVLERFLRSPDRRPLRRHIPAEYRDARRSLLGARAWREEARAIVQGARAVWARMRDPADPFPITHDTYVRLWRDQGGRVQGFDALLIDEAQDLDPLFADILERSDAQRVYVGDPHQQIYAWRGAIDAMRNLSGPEYPLTQSFRFGEEIAAYTREAYRLLTGQEIPLVGAAGHRSRVAINDAFPPRGARYAVLTRTNTGVIDAAIGIGYVHRRPVHIVGGTKELAWLLEDADALMHGYGRIRPHPELAAFRTWEELEALAEELDHPVARALKRLERTYEDLGLLAQVLIRINVPDERGAEAVISTVHRAKGREWDRVYLWEDFPPFSREEQPPEEANIVYVALTRARAYLDPAPLERHLGALRKKQGSTDPKEAAPARAEGR